MTPDLIRYFFIERVSSYAELSEEKKRKLFDIYRTLFGKDIVEEIFPIATGA